jgi:hypothetical protein
VRWVLTFVPPDGAVDSEWRGDAKRLDALLHRWRRPRAIGGRVVPQRLHHHAVPGRRPAVATTPTKAVNPLNAAAAYTRQIL